ncbi:MAG TPA: ABC transporter ATP-binding protein [Candidatus Dormibacteraeota bacterium]|nr:ABC transporter ATP-binding protein [Candidatus Dormibacteraeota bacterium]
MSAASRNETLLAPVSRADTASRDQSDVRLTVEQASYAYVVPGRTAPLFTLEAMSFQARQRELVAILGPNASGKSTLLQLISGALKPLSGRVRLDGFEISQLGTRLRAQRIAVVQQESPLLFPARAGAYVLQGRHPHGRGLRFETREDIAVAENALAQVGAEDLRDRWMDKMSGGEKQRVILARALAQEPLLLLLDEPTLHLDIGAQFELLQRLRRLAEQNRYTVVIVTHELNLAAEFADQIVLLHQGKCLRVGSPAEVYRQELLEQVFDAPLEVEPGLAGTPRVSIRSQRGAPRPLG